MLLYHGPTDVEAELEWHRGIGAVLMAAAIIVHIGHPDRPAEMASMGMVHGTRTSGGPSVELLLQLTTMSYLVWTAAAVYRMADPHPSTALLRWEQVAMAASLAVMTFGMTP
ncbi:conserved hypothetical protein [Aeromicrobium sp. 9AM]|nr:conserved hypothetical protein [Aeromicrobium sp. 9AM]